MPSGRTHDRITWVASIPITALAYDALGQDGLIVGGSFIFAGLMFGPDLDIKSVQVNRWGHLKWFWKPYQVLIPCHRSVFSHGPIIGTAIRLCYLLLPLSILAMAFNIEIPEVSLSQFLIIFTGLELGAASHYLADYLGSKWR